MSELESAYVRIGPPQPNSSFQWEICVGHGQDVFQLALRYNHAEAQAFCDGYNLGIRQGLA